MENYTDKKSALAPSMPCKQKIFENDEKKKPIPTHTVPAKQKIIENNEDEHPISVPVTLMKHTGGGSDIPIAIKMLKLLNYH